MHPRGDQLLSRHVALYAGGKERLDLERKVLAAAFRSSFERSDTEGAALAHKGLCAILQTQLSEGDATSTGSLSGQMKASSGLAPPEQAGVALVETEADAGVGRKAYASGTQPAVSRAQPATSGAASKDDGSPVQLSVEPALDAPGAKGTVRQAGLVTSQPQPAATTTAQTPVASEPQPAGAKIGQAGTQEAALLSPDAEANAESREKPATQEELETALELLEGELAAAQAGEKETAAAVDEKRQPVAASLVDASISNALLHEVKQVQPEEIQLEEFTFSFASEAAQPENPQTFCFIEEDPEIQEACTQEAQTQPSASIRENASPSCDAPFSWPEEVLLSPGALPLDNAGQLSPASEPTHSAQAAPAQQPLALPPPVPAFEADNASLQKSSFSGRISQALERLTSSIPSLPPQPVAHQGSQQQPASTTVSSTADTIVQKYGESEAPPVLAMPVLEPPRFHAPPPRLELDTASMPSDALNNHAQQPPKTQATAMPAPPALPPATPGESDADCPPSAAAIADMLAQSAPPQAVPLPMTPSQLIRTQTYYQILGVNKLSSYDEIHDKFWRLIRRVVRTRYAAKGRVDDVRELKEVLKSICIAHDVLMDPVTRTDYDLRQLGMRANLSAPSVETPADVAGNGTPRTRLMIGELLECANILDRTELQIALDMHKAEPGTMFGTFLVKSGFLNPEELDSALIGQRLISAGNLTVAQFQTAMFRMRDHGSAFFDTLLVEGWVTPAEMLAEVNRQQRTDSAPGTPPAAHVPAPAPPAPAASEPGATAAAQANAEHAAVMAAARSTESDLNAILNGADVSDENNDGN